MESAASPCSRTAPPQPAWWLPRLRSLPLPPYGAPGAARKRAAASGARLSSRCKRCGGSLWVPTRPGRLLAASQPSLEAAPLFLALGLATAAAHARAALWGARPAYAWPATDCQISISIDLALCSLLTLLVVHRTHRSARATAAAAALLPLASPAAVLALHLAAEQWPAFHASLVTRSQRLVASRLRGAHGTRRGAGGGASWSNLGLYEEGSRCAAPSSRAGCNGRGGGGGAGAGGSEAARGRARAESGHAAPPSPRRPWQQ